MERIIKNENSIGAYKGNRLHYNVDSYCIFDIETTGRSIYEEDIIEIAALKIRDNAVVDNFHTYVHLQNRNEVPMAITELTSITTEMLEDAPLLESAISDFFKFIGKDVLVGHNINAFDINFINYRILNTNKILFNDYIDTLLMAKKLVSTASYSLAELIKYFDLKADSFHRALDDCYSNYKVYNSLKKVSDSRRITINNSPKKHIPVTFELIKNPDLFGNDNPFCGKSCVVSGNVCGSQKQCELFLEKITGLKKTGIKMKTDFLILGEGYGKSESSKLSKALQYNASKKSEIKIIEEDDFVNILERYLSENG